MGDPPVTKTVTNQYPELKSAREIDLMRASGRLVAAALRICREMAKPGTRTADIDAAVQTLFDQHGAEPLFKGYPGKTPFPAATCISLNEQVVHGIPSERIIREGDLVKIDTACRLNGWCADSAVTIPVGKVRSEWLRLLDVSEKVLQLAIDEMGRRRYWSEVALRMEQFVVKNRFSLVTSYVGHGIGRIMHEAPQVPNFVSKELKKQDFRLEPGLVLAIEPMVNLGKGEVETLSDHWTVVTRDRLPSVHVEHTVAITDSGVQVLTLD